MKLFVVRVYLVETGYQQRFVLVDPSGFGFQFLIDLSFAGKLGYIMCRRHSDGFSVKS